MEVERHHTAVAFSHCAYGIVAAVGRDFKRMLYARRIEQGPERIYGHIEQLGRQTGAYLVGKA